MIKGRSNQNPPYKYMTDAKWSSLGETMTLKKALDKWWNSIRIKVNDNITINYKCYDGEYDIYELADELELDEDEVLKLQITLNDEYDDDGDGYPIVYATLA